MLVAAAIGAYAYLSGSIRSASITVQSDPPGATVMLDGVYCGVTPCRIDNVSGPEHVVRLTKHRFQPRSQIVKVVRGQECTVNARLSPRKIYSISMTSVPAGATVALDGTELREKTPVQIPDLRPGEYEITVYADAYLPDRREIEVGEGQPHTIEVTLQSKTESYYREAIRKAPETISNYTELAHHYVIANQFDEAAVVFTKALDLACRADADEQHVSRLRQEIQTVYFGMFDFGGGEAQAQARSMIESVLREVTRYSPKSYLPYHVLGSILLATERHKDAEEVLAQGATAVPDHPLLLLTLAKVLYRQRKFEQAAVVLELLLRSQKHNVNARGMLAQVYQRLGNTDLAMQHRRLVASLGKSNRMAAIGALTSLAGFYHRQREFGRAAQTWEKAAELQKDPGLSAQYRMAAAREHAQAGNYDRAIALWQTVIKASTDDSLRDQAQREIKRAQDLKKAANQ